MEATGRKQLWPSWPLLELEPVSSLSVLPALKVLKGGFSPRPALIVDAYPQWHGDGFVADSFGIRSASPGRMMVWPMDAQARDYVAPLALTPNDPPPNRWHYAKAEVEVMSEAELLQRMTTDETIITMAQLASAFAEQNVRHSTHPWADSLNLVVGDSMVDRLSFWNGRLLNRPWQHHGLTALRVPAGRLQDELFLEALAPFVARRNWIVPGGQSGAGHVTIHSGSVPVSQLTPLQDRLVATTHSQIRVETIQTAFDCVPSPQHLIDRHRWDSQRPTQFVWETKFALSAPPPKHIAEFAPVPPSLRRGHCAVDVRIERHDNESPFTNVSHWWRLPRRWEILRAFSDEHYSKINAEGELTLFWQIDGTGRELRMPESDIDAIRHLFLNEPNLFASDLRGTPRRQPFEFTAPGDKGRYLIGAIELFGSLAAASRVLSNRYWRKTLLEMASPARNYTDDTLDNIARRVKSGMRCDAGPLEVVSDRDWKRLAETVAKIAPILKKPTASKGYMQFLDTRREDLQRFIADTPNLADHSQEILDDCEADLQQSLQRRCLEGVLTQGHRWRCHYCGHRNWVSVGSIGPVLACNVCRVNTPLRADFSWDFQMNDFLAEGLREHGLLGMIWALSHLQWEARDCFFFAPPLALYWTYPERRGTSPDSELDICCVADGNFIIGEVKESDRDVNDRLGNDLIAMAKEVRPDKVVIACLDLNAQASLDAQAGRIRSVSVR